MLAMLACALERLVPSPATVACVAVSPDEVTARFACVTARSVAAALPSTTIASACALVTTPEIWVCKFDTFVENAALRVSSSPCTSSNGFAPVIGLVLIYLTLR